ncbi:MAG TPA: ANTAR domain-containing protein [Candidatus Eisenbacteria bacterium]|jgi:two-component system, response regulator PdtaR|nr:ANTAR domain-containing protein [Candidatus Eisenbacteria bacterium]
MRAIRSMFRNERPRWRVAILDADSSSRAVLRAAVEDAGGVVAVEAPLRLDAVAVMKETRPDVVIMAPSLSGTREPALMPRITAELDCPAVLFTRDTDQTVLKQANRAGVMGFMLKPLRAAEVGPTLDLALARFREIRRLQQARAERPLVDQAKGKLMSDRHLSEAEAFRWLRRHAMDSRQRLGDAAREVLAGEAALLAVPEGAR